MNPAFGGRIERRRHLHAAPISFALELIPADGVPCRSAAFRAMLIGVAIVYARKMRPPGTRWSVAWTLGDEGPRVDVTSSNVVITPSASAPYALSVS